MADLEANFMHLQLMHESLARFSENFAGFLYGLNMNAFCVDFPEVSYERRERCDRMNGRRDVEGGKRKEAHFQGTEVVGRWNLRENYKRMGNVRGTFADEVDHRHQQQIPSAVQKRKKIITVGF